MIESFRSKNVILAKTIFCQKARIGGGGVPSPWSLRFALSSKKDRGLKKKRFFWEKTHFYFSKFETIFNCYYPSPKHFIPRRWTIFSGPLWGPNLISFCLISFSTPRQVFWISICWRYLLIFDPPKFSIPRRWTIFWWSPMGSPFDLFLFYIGSWKNFFSLQFAAGICSFLTPGIF